MASDNDNDMKVEPDVHDFADDPAHAAQDSTLSVSATPPPQLYRIKSETESPAKPVPSELATRRSTRVRRVTVKQELLGSSTTLPVSDIKREVVKKVVKAKGKAKAKRGYAPPEQYAHLQLLPEYLKEDLDILFCGINPAVRSAEIGHHYGHRSNHFWPCLVESGLTNGQVVTALEDHTIAERFNYGMTNIVERPSAEAAELSTKEMVASVPSLLRKVARYRPRILTLVGKVVWDALERGIKDMGVPVPKRTGKAACKVQYDIQPFKVVHPSRDGHEVFETLFFVLPSSSARVVAFQMKDKTKLFALLKQRLQEIKEGAFDTSSMTVIPIPAAHDDTS